MQQDGIIDLYNKSDNEIVNRFVNHVDSKVHVAHDVDRVTGDYEWITLFEDTIQYIDNILRNPNRFIVNEEDIVKIELARRVTVESIKHLSRNTNLIQDYDKKTGDVKPSKILNINKEESFNTYENRFIFSLIENMVFFVSRKKQTIVNENRDKNDKKIEYTSISRVGKENIKFNFSMSSLSDTSNKILDENGNDVETRITKIEQRIADLKSTELYKTIHRLHISLVTSPIKKTNVILKNVNFQYAVKLWNYLQEHVNDPASKEEKNKTSYDDNGKLKGYFDDTFLLNYLAMCTLDEDKTKDLEDNKEEVTERLIGNVVEKLIDINETISQEQLSEIVAKQYTIVKNKYVVTDNKIKEIYHNAIDKYMHRISELKFEQKEEKSELDEKFETNNDEETS